MKKQRLVEKLLSGSKEDEGYIADIPDLRHCSGFGATPEKALREVLEAKAAWLEAAREQQKPIPDPRYRPPIDHVALPNPEPLQQNIDRERNLDRDV